MSWSRILPSGFIHRVNPDGIRYYNEVINALIAQNVTPVITLYHWDLPSTIQELGGWTNDAIVYYFEDYARLAFETFGDRVKTWITINEPVIVCKDGYGEMNKAPALNLSGIGEYVCMHNLLKAHAAAYHVYDKEFRPTQKGKYLQYTYLQSIMIIAYLNNNRNISLPILIFFLMVAKISFL